MDPLRLDPSARLPLTGTLGERRDARLEGSLRGETVVAQDSDGISDDAMEEISLLFAERAEEEEFDEEKIEAHSQPQVMSAEQVMSYLDNAKHGDEKDKLVALARSLLQNSGHPGAQARQAYGDPTQQYLALQYALQQGEREGADAARLEALRDAIADLEQDHGAQIRARLNTVGVASQQGGDAPAVAQFQATYADIALGAPTLAQTLNLALERFGAQGLAQGLQGLIAAVGADLAATRPSTDPARLATLVQDLYQLEVVATAFEKAQQLAEGLAERHGLRGLDAERLVRDLVALTAERWVGATHFETLLQQHGVTDLQTQIGLLTGIKTLLRELPPRVFADADSRQTVQAAVQQALDELIAREEQS